jgi:peptidylprolyl isomerase
LDFLRGRLFCFLKYCAASWVKEGKEEKVARAKYGDTVKVDYSCFSEDGNVISETKNTEPLQFTIGKDQIIPGFEEAVLGMDEGEEKKSTVPMEKGFGPRREDNIVVVEKEKFPEHIKVEVGQQLQIRSADGTTSLVRVADLSEGLVTLDANHPLAGKNLIFNIRLLEIL